jgi:CRISPR-associated protein Cmr6
MPKIKFKGFEGLNQLAHPLGIILENSEQSKGGQADFTEEEVPMMYQAQIDGRCSLQFAGSNSDLERWREEWIDSQVANTPRYQNKEPNLGLDGFTYRIKIEFPFRLFSNCGQDSILRPIMGKNGIPYLSGSSVKGLFRRGCKNNPNKLKLYCGDEDNLSPSTIGFRFHGAYPIGDWSGFREVKVRRRGETITENRYRMLDVIHPQQPRQIEKDGSPNAFAMVSLYQPTMIFEFSSADPANTDWQEVENIFLESIQLGVGGKTSTGYGLGGHLPNHPSRTPNFPVNVAFKGCGVSPTLRSDEPEFRPNLFKATLRGHVKRLLGGVTQSSKEIEDRLFGSSSNPSQLQISWQETSVKYNEVQKPATFITEGILHIKTKEKSDELFVEQILKFAFVMGGFGKSWRRTSHEIFYKDYVNRKFEIGCYWELASTDLKWINIKSIESLNQFIEDLHKLCKDKFGDNPANHQSAWRESWHPDRVTVYAKVANESHVIRLFHDDIFKTTPAIGGKNVGDTRPKFMSHVWHRMLPIGNGQYLEIVTVFHGQRDKWKHQNKGDQLKPFLDAIAAQGLIYVWGKEKPLEEKIKLKLKN